MTDTSIFIDGAAGTTGLQIRERLEGRQGFTLIALDDTQRKDAAARAQALNDADVVILCLPDDAARESVSLIRNDRTKVIDASTAHRTAPGWAYGLPEIKGRDVVASAARISNPGCYPTGFLALVAPLVAAGALPADALLSCNAVSGYSGGGKAMIADYEGDAPSSAWATYALTLAHKHGPEMQAHAGLRHRPIFAPSVAPIYSGMIVEVPLHTAQLAAGETAASLRERLAAYYAGSSIVSVAEAHEGATLPVELMADTDAMRLFVFGDAGGTQVRLVAALDNLGKGASGAAVQSLNLVTGHPDNEGLRLPGA